ncbi:MAG: 30S ribosomal protein S12 methylthiotransferase accessory factor YcaO [Helicobacteraceae bacterium]|jgi:ribosomal protein S12 methylthiotransferase accessory factor|nr:30S ribosomal protein S12 methylthiotransferase accessory factor YcaO [Helicobacteraceae bacterium]
MAEKTFIKGKDRDLESTIETMHNKLKAWDIHVEEASWLNPVPYVHSLHIREKSCGLMFTNGKGATEKSCLASALGEYFERLSSNYFFADYYLGEEISSGDFVHYPNEKWFDNSGDEMPEGLLDEELWDFYDPEGDLDPESIFDFNSGLGERGICALPFERQSDSETIYFPVNFLGNLYVSNGMAAGNSVNEARVQALAEICERYVKNQIIAGGISLPEIPQDVIARFPHIEESIEKLKAHGFNLKVADASLGGLFPVISVTLMNPADGSVLASFGAHPCFEVALERTVTELLQGRGIDQVDDFQVPSFNLAEVADNNNLVEHFINSTGLISYDFFKKETDYQFVDWNHDAATETEFDYLCNIIHERELEIYIADYQHLDVYTCRIIVPGMSEIYPIEDLMWSNNNEGAHFREYLLSLDKLGQEGWERVLENLEDESLQDTQKVAEFIGVAADPGTRWASLQVGTLKEMLALALQDLEQAMEWNNWSLHIGQLNKQEKQHHQCIKALLEIVLDDAKNYADYNESLELLYGAKTLQECVALVQGKTQFHGLHFPGLSLDGFNAHQQLLSGYKKLHRAKQENWK